MDALLDQQIAYYRARAPEYDEWFLRQGRYDRGPEHNARWFAEAEEVAAALVAFGPTGQVLELACGTGLWTERLAAHADRITAVDAAPEVIALNRARLAHRSAACPVEYVCADLFAWVPPDRYDVVFFSFWLSHVPPERFDGFWDLVALALYPGGRFFLVDSRREPSSTAQDHRLPANNDATTLRRLNDGREYEIYKVFYEPELLRRRLERLGWRSGVTQTATYFIYAHGERADAELLRAADQIVAAARRLLVGRGHPLLVALDGGSGSGKSVLAALVTARLDAALVPADDFFAAGITEAEWGRRTAAEKARDALDWRRLRAQALEPLLAGERATWHPFDFTSGARPDGTYGMSERAEVREPAPVIVLDGAYSTRPELGDLIDLSVLVDAPLPVRHQRLAEREEAGFLADWHARWDEAEAWYFTHVRPRSAFDLVVTNG